MKDSNKLLLVGALLIGGYLVYDKFFANSRPSWNTPPAGATNPVYTDSQTGRALLWTNAAGQIVNALGQTFTSITTAIQQTRAAQSGGVSGTGYPVVTTQLGYGVTRPNGIMVL